MCYFPNLLIATQPNFPYYSIFFQWEHVSKYLLLIAFLKGHLAQDQVRSCKCDLSITLQYLDGSLSKPPSSLQVYFCTVQVMPLGLLFTMIANPGNIPLFYWPYRLMMSQFLQMNDVFRIRILLSDITNKVGWMGGCPHVACRL